MSNNELNKQFGRSSFLFFLLTPHLTLSLQNPALAPLQQRQKDSAGEESRSQKRAQDFNPDLLRMQRNVPTSASTATTALCSL